MCSTKYKRKDQPKFIQQTALNWIWVSVWIFHLQSQIIQNLLRIWSSLQNKKCSSLCPLQVIFLRIFIFYSKFKRISRLNFIKFHWLNWILFSVLFLQIQSSIIPKPLRIGLNFQYNSYSSFHPLQDLFLQNFECSSKVESFGRLKIIGFH